MARLLVFLTLAYVAGITLGRFFMPYVFILPAIAAFLWALWQVFCAKKGVQVFIPLLLLFLVAGGLRYHHALAGVKGNVRDFAGENCTLVGMIDDEPLWREDDIVFPLRSRRIICKGKEYPVSGKVQVTVQFGAFGSDWKDEKDKFLSSPESASLNYGQNISLPGVIYEPKEKRNPGGFDHRAFLEGRGIASSFYGSAKDIVSLGLSPDLSRLRCSALLLKNKMAAVLKAFLPEREGNLLVGMLFGERSSLEKETEDTFSKSGVAHLLAVSGLHTGLVAGAIFFLGRRLGLRGGNAYLFSALLLFAYVYLCGLKPSAIRAFIMILLSMGAVHLGRTGDFPTALSAAALITLVYNPFLLFSVSFQLSYAAATAILSLTPLLQVKINAVLDKLSLPLKPSYLRGFSSLFAVTLAAQLGVIPLTAYYFRQVSLAALVANIFVLPVMPAVMGLGLVSASLGLLLPPMGALLNIANYPLLSYVLFMARMVSALPFAYCEVYPPQLTEIALYYAIIAAIIALSAGGWRAALGLYRRLKFRFKPFHLLVFFLVLALLAVWGWPGLGFSPLEVVFLDVGQGDAIFMRTPQGQNILLDSGGKPAYRGDIDEPGRYVVLPFLEHRRIKKLDMVIISHPHEDHYGGLFAVLEKIPVKQLVTTAEVSETQSYNELLELAQEKNISREIASEGDLFTAGPSFKLKVLGPPPELFSGTSSDSNNNSLVLHLQYKEVGFLFTGDMEKEAVEYLLAEGCLSPIKVLKVPHHGAHLSNLPLFLEQIAPQTAIISVGANTFGHPRSETLEGLENHGIKIYRTDFHGAVTIRSNGHAYETKTMLFAPGLMTAFFYSPFFHLSAVKNKGVWDGTFGFD